MKTLVVLLLLALALGAAHWTSERPGEGFDALFDEARLTASRLGERVRGDAAPAIEGALATGPEPEGDPAALGGALPESVGATDPMDPTGTRPTNGADGTSEALADTATAFGASSGPAPSGADARTAGDVDALGSRVAALENELTRTMTASESSVVQSRLDEAERRLAASEAGLETSLAGLGERMDTLLARVETLAERDERGREALADRLEDLAGRTEALDERVGTFADLLAGGGAAVADPAAGAAIAATALRVPALEGDDRARPATGASAADASSIAALASVDRRLAALESDRREGAAGSRGGADLTERLDGLGRRLDALAASVDELATRSDALSIDRVQGEVRDELRSLADEVGQSGAAGADAAGLAGALQSTRERVAELEARVRELPASSSAAGDAQQTQSALETQIRALAERIEALPDAPDAELADGLDDVRERVAELSNRGFVTQEELRAQVEGRNVEYKIYFDKNSTDISDEAAAVLDSFIAQETNRTAGVSIFGFTDTQGPASYNQRLAQGRAANVRSYLIRNGFDYTKIDNVAGLGEDASTAVLGDEQEDANQRVVVLFAAQI